MGKNGYHYLRCIKPIFAVTTAVLALLIGATQGVFAAPIILSCQPAIPGSAFALTLDMDNKTVSGDNVYSYEMTGPFPIQVTDNEISWTSKDTGGNPQSNDMLSRVTLSFEAVGAGGASGLIWNAQCHKSDKQF